MIKEYLLSEENQRILISVKRSSRKSIGLEVRAAGEVIVRIPNRLSDKRLKEFIETVSYTHLTLPTILLV